MAGLLAGTLRFGAVFRADATFLAAGGFTNPRAGVPEERRFAFAFGGPFVAFPVPFPVPEEPRLGVLTFPLPVPEEPTFRSRVAVPEERTPEERTVGFFAEGFTAAAFLVVAFVLLDFGAAAVGFGDDRTGRAVLAVSTTPVGVTVAVSATLSVGRSSGCAVTGGGTIDPRLISTG